MPNLLVSLLALACALIAHPSRAIAADLDDLVVTPAVIELGPGEQADLTVTGVYDDGSQQDLTNDVIFISEDTDVVITSGRTVIAVGEGDTEIRVEHPATGVRADSPPEVTVLEIVELTIAPPTATIEVGQQTQLAAQAELDGGRIVDVTDLVDWESDDTGVATVIGGLVSGNSVGEAEIKVTDPASGTQSDNDAAVITVQPVPDPNAELLEMYAAPEDAPVIVGDVIQLAVTGEFDDDTVRDITDDVTYESNRPAVASVDSSGKVYALTPGTASIRIEHPPSGTSVSDRPEIWVGELEEIHLSPTSATLLIGDNLQVAAVATYDNGLGSDATELVSWSSDAAGIASVSSVAGTRGLVSANSVGIANLAALHLPTGIRSPESEGEITVVAPTPSPSPVPTPTPVVVNPIRDLVFVPPVVRLRPGETAPLQVWAVHADGSMTDVTFRATYKSRARRIATITGGGEVTAVTEGHAEIAARDPISGRRARMPARVEVTRVLRLRVVPATADVLEGEDTAFMAYADLDDGSTDVDVTGQVTWDVVGPDGIATVDDGVSKGLASGVAEGRVVVRATDPVSGMSSDGSTGRLTVGSPPAEDPLALVALSFAPAHVVVPHRGEAGFAVSAVQADGTLVPLPIGDVRLRSLTRRIVRAKSDGTLFGRRPGVGTIEVTHVATGISGRLPVTVLSRSRIAIDPATSVVEVGDTIDLTANVTYNDGTGPVDETGVLRWRSLDPSLAAPDGSLPGRIVAKKEGIAIIEASHRKSRTRSDAKSGVIHVVTGLVRISVSPRALALALAATHPLQALAHYSDGSVVDVTADVTWSLSNGAVASIDAFGVLTADAVGDTFVTATHDESGLSSEGLDRGVVAVGRSLVGLQVSRTTELEEDPRRVFLAAGYSTQLFGLAVLDAGGPADWTDDVFWISSQPASVSVTQDGVVTCGAIGSSEISVVHLETPLSSTTTLGNTIVTCSAATVDRLEVRPETSNVDYPNGRNLRAYRVFSDGHEVEITTTARWTSGMPGALSVVETGPGAGRVTGLDDGIVTVTADDPGFGLSGDATVTVRKVRVDLRIFENVPEPDNDGVFRGQVGDLIKLKARVEYVSGVTQGVNQIVDWTSSNTAVVQMGADAGLQKNWGRMVGPGTATITATWPADEHSPELTDSVEFEVSN